MDDQLNADRIREALDAFTRGDVDAVLASWNDDPVFHRGGRDALAGTYRGVEELKRLLASAAGGAPTGRRTGPIECLADRNHAAAIYRVAADRDGGAVNATVAYAARFDASGKQEEGWLLVSDPSAWDPR